MTTNPHLDAVAPMDAAYAPPPPPMEVTGAGAPAAELFGGYPVATIGKRIGAWLLESVLATVTLGIGWLIWAAMLAGEGQTPAKKLLGMRVRRADTGGAASFGTMLFMRGIVGYFIASLAYTFTLGILALMPLWDKRNQSVTDKVSTCVVVSES